MSYYSPWKAVHHPDRLAAIREGRPVIPTSLQIDLEGWCPHSCLWCSYRNVGWQDHGMQFQAPRQVGPDSGLPREVALALPEQMAALGIRAVELTGGGEPLASPYVGEFLDLLDERGIAVALVTNGVYLHWRNRQHLHNPAWVRVSLDAATADTHALVHRTGRGAFGLILDNLRQLLATRGPTTRVGVSYMVAPENAHEIVAAAHLCRDLGLDSIRYSPVYEPSGTGRLDADLRAQVEEALAAARRLHSEHFEVFAPTARLGYYARPNTDFARCHVRRFVWAVGVDARVYPCCIQKYQERAAIGDLRVDSLAAIAEREAGRELDVRACKPCWMRDKNVFIDYLVEPNPEHVDYV